MTTFLTICLVAVAFCLADNIDRWRWSEKLRRCGIRSYMRPTALDWLLALLPPAYAVRRWHLWR